MIHTPIESLVGLFDNYKEKEENIIDLHNNFLKLDIEPSRVSCIIDGGDIILQYAYLLQKNKQFVSCIDSNITVNKYGISYHIGGYCNDNGSVDIKTLEEVLDFAIVSEINQLSKPKTEKPPNLKYLYLMKNRRNGYIKIGVSVKPEYREKTLQSEEPEIELIWSTKEMIDCGEELGLHEKYNEKRIRGEWFILTKKDIADIKREYKNL